MTIKKLTLTEERLMRNVNFYKTMLSARCTMITNLSDKLKEKNKTIEELKEKLSAITVIAN